MRHAALSMALGVGLVLGAGLPVSCAWAQAAPVGGDYKVVADEKGVWWFVGPDGKRFISIGVDNVTPRAWRPPANTKFYDAANAQFAGNMKAWADDTRKLLLDNGFNTLGAWSGAEIPTGDHMVRTIVLYMAGNEMDRCLDALLPGYQERARANLRTEMAKYAPGEKILGVYLDNEMPWWGKSGWDKIPTYTLLEKAIELPKENPRRGLAVKYLQDKYKSADALGKAYGRALASWDTLDTQWLQAVYSDTAMKDRAEFTGIAAEAFYKLSTEIVRAELPGTLILGTRFSGEAPDLVVASAGKYCDVVSFNDYNGSPSANMDLYTKFWLVGKKPIMLTEFSWRAKDNQSGTPNTRGAGAVLPGQEERAANYAAFVPDAMATPALLGVHWFEFADQSPQGRFDGEDSNYGIVDINNGRYEKLLGAMKAAHTNLHEIHASSTRVMPTELPSGSAYGDRKVSYAPAQHPERPPTQELLSREWCRSPDVWGANDTTLGWAWADEKSNVVMLKYNAGKEYGCGINFFGPTSSVVKGAPQGSTDLDGYYTIVVEASVPQDLEMLVVLSEASSGPTWQAKFDTGVGDDGEAFISTPVRGEGKTATYKFPIKDFQLQQFHGNQKGKHVVDMQATLCIGLQVRGSPQSGEVTVRSIRLER